MGGVRERAVSAEAYRVPMPVTEIRVLADRTSYYLCPRCHTPVEREFSAFCDRCGQRLGWKDYKKARRI